MKPIQAALAALILSAAHPAFAETLLIKGVPVPPVQTVEQARAETEKRLTAIQAEEGKQAAEAAAQLSTRDALPATTPQEAFYTGKPLIEETGQYAFLFRHYDPELGRWTTPDPSGFPDGANNTAYLPVPTSQIDLYGLTTINSFSDAWNYWKRENGSSSDTVQAGPAIISAIKGSSGFNDLLYRVRTQRIHPQLVAVAQNSQSGFLADGPLVGPANIGFVDIIIGRTSISYSDSSEWSALSNFYFNGNDWGRDLKATTTMNADFSDVWDFTTHPNDPWWMNLIEETVPGWIAGAGTPFNIDGLFTHSFDTYAWQPE